MIDLSPAIAVPIFTDRIGAPVTLFTGGPWWPHDPRAEDVRVGDLAALAQITRFGGACSYVSGHPRAGQLAPYVVGHHSCLVHDLVEEWGGTIGERREALCHDGHEIYPPGDVLGPVMFYDCPATRALREMSRAAEVAFRTALGLPLELSPIVKRADLVMLATEKRDFIAPNLQTQRPLPPPRERIIEVWDHEHARAAFWRRFDRLFPGAR